MTSKKEWRDDFLTHLAETGNVKASCRKAGISRKTAYKHRDNDKEFRQAWEQALTVAISILEDEAWRRAVRGVNDPVFYKGEKVGAVKKYSDTLLIFLLKAHDPKKYRERLDITTDNQPITNITVQYVDTLRDDHSDDPA